MKRLFNRKNYTREVLLILAVALIWNCGSYALARLIAGSWRHYDMTTAIDRLIPLVPWTIIVYFGCYLFWGVNYCLCAMQDRTSRDRFFCADALAKLVCFALFLLVPTTNVRPEIIGETMWDHLMRLLYRIDSADNLFPSIHCLVSWLCWIGVRKRSDIPAVYRRFSFVATVAVCISTLTTYQHVIADVFAAVLIAEACYYFAGCEKVRDVYSAMIGKMKKLLRV